MTLSVPYGGEAEQALVGPGCCSNLVVTAGELTSPSGLKSAVLCTVRSCCCCFAPTPPPLPTGLLQHMPGLGIRSIRYSMLVDDGKVVVLNIEEPGGCLCVLAGGKYGLGGRIAWQGFSTGTC